jgi:hypothetical protein
MIVTGLIACDYGCLLYEVLRNPPSNHYYRRMPRFLSYLRAFVDITHMIDYNTPLSTAVGEH